MFWLAALAATVAQPDARLAVTPLRQARASVRIVRAEPIRFRQIEAEAPGTLRRTFIRVPGGERSEARLREFE